MAATFERAREKAKMTTRPRRDSTSSLAAAIQAKEKKDAIGEWPVTCVVTNSNHSLPLLVNRRPHGAEQEVQQRQGEGELHPVTSCLKM